MWGVEGRGAGHDHAEAKSPFDDPQARLRVANEPAKNGNKVDKVAPGQGPAKEELVTEHNVEL